MNHRSTDNIDEPELEAPQALRGDLSALFGTTPPVPAGVDDRVLAMARREFLRRKRRRVVVRIAAGFAAAAAVFLAVFALGAFDGLLPQNRAVAAKDIDRSGAVDILDAFALARRVEAEEPHDAWDFNGDGVVDRLDVDVVAQAAVSLSPRREM